MATGMPGLAASAIRRLISFAVSNSELRSLTYFPLKSFKMVKKPVRLPPGFHPAVESKCRQKRYTLSCQYRRHGPTATTCKHLHCLHIHVVNVWTLFSVNFNRDVIRIDKLHDLFIFRSSAPLHDTSDKLNSRWTTTQVCLRLLPLGLLPTDTS